MPSSSIVGPVVHLGVVPYLNVQPLIWSLQRSDALEPNSVEIRSAPPRELAVELARGQHHAAIVPVFEYLRRPDFYTIVPGVSIASRDQVHSVILFSSCPLEHIKRVHLDVASLTSVNLLRVLLAERGLNPMLLDRAGPAATYNRNWYPGQPLSAGDAALLIGDPAMQEQKHHPFQYDMGVLWKELTGLPFVFAAWLVQPSARDLPLNELLLNAKEQGTANFSRIAEERASQFGSMPAEALRYFRENLCYDLGAKELQGWRRFAELCAHHALIDNVPEFKMHSS